MARQKVKIAKTHEESEAAWAGQYFKQWQEVTKELAEARQQLAEYRTNFELKEQTIEMLSAENTKSYIAGMEEMRRLAIKRVQSWVADNAAVTGFDPFNPIYSRLMNAVVWAVRPLGDDSEKQS